MNRFPFTLVALAAAYTPGSRFRTDFADHSLNSKTFIDDGNDTSDGAGGANTEQVKKSDGVDTNVISSVDGAGTGQQQDQTSDATVAPGTVLNASANDDKKVDEASTGLGEVKAAIGDPSAGQTQQV